MAADSTVTGDIVDPGWSRGGSASRESVAADPPTGPGLAESASVPVEGVEPENLLLAGKPGSQRPPENRQDTVSDPRSAAPASPPNPGLREPVKPSPPRYPVAQEPVYREKSAYWDDW